MMVQVSTVTAKNNAAVLEEEFRPFASIRALVKAAFHMAVL